MTEGCWDYFISFRGRNRSICLIAFFGVFGELFKQEKTNQAEDEHPGSDPYQFRVVRKQTEDQNHNAKARYLGLAKEHLLVIAHVSGQPNRQAVQPEPPPL